MFLLAIATMLQDTFTC